MKKCLDVEKSLELGQFYCKSMSFFKIYPHICHCSNTTYVGMYVNMCVEMKKWIDIKDRGEPDDIGRRKLLFFYDIIPTHDDFNEVSKEDFRVLEDRVRNEKRARKKPDLSGLTRFQSLGPPPKKPLLPRPLLVSCLLFIDMERHVLSHTDNFCEICCLCFIKIPLAVLLLYQILHKRGTGHF